MKYEGHLKTNREINYLEELQKTDFRDGIKALE